MSAPQLRPYQKAAVEFATKNLIESGNSLLVCATGGGKGHSPDMIIPTPDGFRRWGDLRVGDKLFGCDGKPQHIKRIFPRGLQPFYRIKFASGAEVECDSDHIWQMSNGKKFTTHELWLKPIKNGRKYLYDVPYCEPLDYPEQKFMISPYTMGVLIGDGYLCGKSVCFSNPIMDIEIKNRVESELPDKFYLSIHNWGCPQYTICKPRGDYRNAFYNEIINMGLSVKSSDKFIPKQYLVGSVRQRMDLLAGLLDTDGSCQRRSKHSSTTFSTTSVRLANNVADLVRSLGGWASVKTKTRGEICVHIQTIFNPFYLSRKSNKWNGKRTKNYIREIEYIGCKQSICVSVSNQDQLYITDGYVVTHNTAMLAKVAEFLIQNAGCRKVYCIVGTDKVNQQNKETIRKFAPGIAVSEYSGRLKSQHGKIICMMQQTANIHYMNLPAPDGLLIDEGHHARAETYDRLLKYWKPKYLFGATATPDRGDKKSLATLFSNYYQITSKELIDMNYLCRPIFVPFECNIDSDIAVRRAMMKLPLQPGKTIHFCRNHEYAKRLYDIITGLSMECAYLRLGGDNDAEYAKFASDECNHLVNVNIATEGFDEPRIMNVVNWCSDGTRGRMIQKYGRGLRPYRSKKQCMIFDCGGNIEKYGDLEYTEILPKELVKPKGQFLRIEDLFYEKPDDDEDVEEEIDTRPRFSVGEKTMPYSPPDGWFSFYDIDFGTVFLRMDGRYARFVENGEIREVCIRQDNLFELDDFDLPGAKKTPTDYLNSWQLKSLTDIPTFGFSPEQADAVIAWKIWKKTKRDENEQK